MLGRFWVGPGAHLPLDFCSQDFQVETQAPENVYGDSLAQLNQAEEQMFGPDKMMVEAPRLLPGKGEHLRVAAARLIYGLLNRSDITVLPQTCAVFLQGVRLYDQRRDKGYSLTDCISMGRCAPKGLTRRPCGNRSGLRR